MNIIVIGATGTVGRLTVAQLLEQGHEVTGFARNPEKLDQRSERLRLRAGDATDAGAVSEAVAGHDAVVVTLGAGSSRKSRIRSQGTMNVIRAMQEHGVRRLICQSTLGTHESWDNLNFFWKRIMFGALLRPVFLDHELQEQLVRASGLDWTIVRPSAFTDAPVAGKIREGFAPQDRQLKLKIRRVDVAGFLTRQVQDPQYLHKAVGLSA